MKEYEVIHEIFFFFSNNQMRDVFFEEVMIEDLEAYIRGKHKDSDLKMEREELADGTIIYHVESAGISQRYSFTEI